MFGADLGPKVPIIFAEHGGVQQPTPVCRVSGSKAYAGNTEDYMVAMRSAGDGAITCRIRDLLMKASSCTVVLSNQQERTPPRVSFQWKPAPRCDKRRARPSECGVRERLHSGGASCFPIVVRTLAASFADIGVN